MISGIQIHPSKNTADEDGIKRFNGPTTAMPVIAKDRVKKSLAPVVKNGVLERLTDAITSK